MPKRGYADVLDPTKKMPLEEKIGRSKEKLVESDRRSLAGQIASAEEEIRERKEHNPDADISEVKKEIDHKKMILQHDDDLTPKSGTTRDRLASRGREIESLLKSNMPNKREMQMKPGTTDSSRAIRRNLKFQEQYDPLCREWQDIQKRLNPDDPEAQSLELIRPD